MNSKESEVALSALMRKELKTRKLVIPLRRVDEVHVVPEAIRPTARISPHLDDHPGPSATSTPTDPVPKSFEKAEESVASQEDEPGIPREEFQDILDHLNQRRARQQSRRVAKGSSSSTSKHLAYLNMLLKMSNLADKDCRTHYPFTSLLRNVTTDPQHGLPTPEVIDIYTKGSRVVREEHIRSLSPSGRAKLARVEKSMRRKHPFENVDELDDTTTEDSDDENSSSGDSASSVSDDDAIDDSAEAPEVILIKP